jgi:hypothetical protein
MLVEQQEGIFAGNTMHQRQAADNTDPTPATAQNEPVLVDAL